MTLVPVATEEIQQGFQAIPVAEHDRREVSIEKLHAISNRGWPIWAWDWGIEWLEVKLKHVGIIVPAVLDTVQSCVYMNTQNSQRYSCKEAITEHYGW